MSSAELSNNEVLPKDWISTPLGELANQITKGTTPTTAGHSYKSEGIPFIKIENINDYGISLASVVQFIDEKAHAALLRSQFQLNDVLFSIAGTIGKTAIVREDHIPANTNQAVAIIRGITDYFEPLFLKLQLKEAAERIAKDNARGGAMNNISLGDLKNVMVSLPSSAEQQIAQKLDELLAQVDILKARLNTIPKILKRFRQSVLAAAISGRWTEATLDQRFIGDICEKAFDGPFGSKLKTSDYADAGIRVARLENIGHLFFDNEKKTFVDLEKYETLISNTLKSGDVLFSSFVDEEVRVCVFNEKSTFINKADCFCLRPNDKKVMSEFLAYTLASITSYSQIKEQVQGVTRPRVNLKILKSLSFNFPPLEEQTEIVRRVEQFFTYADQIEQRVKDAQIRVTHLTKSILAKAFRGELTADWRAQNPELISGENSAAALLERIKAEREANALGKKASGKKRLSATV